jgi:hypothetical protein
MGGLRHWGSIARNQFPPNHSVPKWHGSRLGLAVAETREELVFLGDLREGEGWREREDGPGPGWARPGAKVGSACSREG